MTDQTYIKHILRLCSLSIWADNQEISINKRFWKGCNIFWFLLNMELQCIIFYKSEEYVLTCLFLNCPFFLQEELNIFATKVDILISYICMNTSDIFPSQKVYGECELLSRNRTSFTLLTSPEKRFKTLCAKSGTPDICTHLHRRSMDSFLGAALPAMLRHTMWLAQSKKYTKFCSS